MRGKFFHKLIVTGMLVLSGCTLQRDKADCGISKGVGCKSVTEINKLVTAGELEKINDPSNKVGTSKKPRMLTMDASYQNSNEPTLGVNRTPEQTARVWVSGFDDEMGDYVQETYIYTVLEGGRWSNAH